jgi:hypothetical protein
MIDMQSIGIAVTSMKAAGDIAKGLLSLNTMAEVQSTAIELNQQILTAQHQLFVANTTQTELASRIRELEAQLLRLQDWDTQKRRYRLAAPFAGCMVYALQKAASDGEPPHYLCASCYQKGEKAILQGRNPIQPKPGQGRAYAHFICPVCDSEATTRWMNIPVPQFFEDIQPEQ